MIKPASYWALHKTADALTLGRVGLALAGRAAELNPPLSPAEKCLVSVIEQDSVWMDERMAERREKVKAAVKAHRERQKSENVQTVAPSTVPAREPDLSKVDTSDEAFFSGQDAVLLACKITGDTKIKSRRFWRNCVRRNENEFLEELNKFKHELDAGEVPEIPAAAFTARIKHLAE